jgi:hypothetical protein
MSEAAPVIVTEIEEAAPAAPRRGRPPKTPGEVKAHVDAAFAEAETAFHQGPMARVVISVKPSEAWRCPWVEGRITKPREEVWVPLDLAQFMEANEQAIILERKD